MAASNVPAFGNWESDGNVPYTVYFDKARKNKGGNKMVNPNDIQANQYTNRDIDPPHMPPAAYDPRRQRGNTKPADRESNGGESIKSTPDRNHIHREDNIHYRSQFSNPPARNVNIIRTAPSESSYGDGGGQRVQRPGRSPGAGYNDQSFERSPFHPQEQAVIRERRMPQSPAPWDEIQYGSSRSTPSRAPRQRLTPQRNESPERGATVPKFGDWNENDPRSAENFTGVFERVRDERNAPQQAAPVRSTPKQSSHSTRTLQPSSNKHKNGCFSWLNKITSGSR